MSLVKVSGDLYSITETPSYNSKIVQKVSMTLQKDVCITSISAKLNEVEECLRIAYYATTDNKELRRKTQDMQFDIQKLCAKCDTTMLKIKLKCGDILNELQCGFGYLLEGFEEFGMQRLNSAGPIADEIQVEAKSLTSLLNTQDLAVKGSRKIVTELDDEAAVERRKRQLQAEQNVRAQDLAERRSDVNQSSANITRLSDRERSALQATRDKLESSSGFGFGLKKILTFGFYQGDMPRAQQEERLAKEMREEQARERVRLNQLRDEERMAKIELERFVVRMNTQPKEMSNVAIQGAESGLKALESFLQSLADFWDKNQAEFESISNAAFIDQLKNLGDAEKRKRFWTSRVFKMEALGYITRYVNTCQAFKVRGEGTVKGCASPNWGLPKSLCQSVRGQHQTGINHDVTHQICLTFDVTRRWYGVKTFIVFSVN
jgi:hypothetical protein